MTTLLAEPAEGNRWSPRDGVERQALMDQLDAIVNSVYFRSSKRYPNFLRFVVKEKLSGRENHLKERTIGIEVFGRDTVYDTSEDPIVRVAAAEVRKRLANYYADPSHANELRIYLSSGSYIPSFKKPCGIIAPEPESLGKTVGATVPPVESSVADPARAEVSRKFPTKHSRLWLWAAVAVVMVALSSIVLIRHRPEAKQLSSSPSDALNAFWRPMTDSHDTILASMGPVPALHPASSPFAPTPNMGLLEAIRRYNVVPLPDAIALSTIGSFLGQRRIHLRVMNSDMTSFDDVQSGPTILIGALTNQWTLRLTSKLRFTFEDSPTISRILDRQAKVQPGWVLHRRGTYSTLTRDYAVVARYHDLTTGSMIMIAGGIVPNGTLAACEFLTNGEDLVRLLDSVPRKNWEYVNVEAVISTQVIDGTSGPPQIVAAKFW